jgi:hypothetical protein
VDFALDELLNDDENVLRGKGDHDHDHAPSCFSLVTCHLRLTDGLLPKARRIYGENDIQVALVFYSTFEQLDLPCSGPSRTSWMFRSIRSPTLTRYVGQVSNVLGRVPLMPLFLLCNATERAPKLP